MEPSMAAPSNAKLSAERISDPDGFERKCAAAIGKAQGNVREAARELGVSRRTLTRYIEDSQALRRALREARKGAET
jgi:DNA-binding NtrC family response regulator